MYHSRPLVRWHSCTAVTTVKLQCFRHPKRAPVLWKQSFPFPPSLSPWQTTSLLACFLNLLTLDTLCKRNHTIFDLLCPDSVTYSVFKIHPCCSIQRNFISSCAWIIPTVSVPRAVCPSIVVGGHRGCPTIWPLRKVLLRPPVLKLLFKYLCAVLSGTHSGVESISRAYGNSTLTTEELFPQGPHHFILTPATQEGPSFSTSSPTLVTFLF